MNRFTESDFATAADLYLKRLRGCFSPTVLSAVETLAEELHRAWINRQNVYLCGNGGSAGNAIHLANDFHFGIGACGPKPVLPGLRVEALPANSAILTCLANDIGYENIYSHQLEVKGNACDVLIVLSGSGNSQNIVNALQTGSSLGMKTFAILGFSGGRCLQLADVPIHFEVDDMQVAEDTQMIVGHMCMQWLSSHKPDTLCAK